MNILNKLIYLKYFVHTICMLLW